MADWSYCEYRIAGDTEELDRLFEIMQKVENAEGGPWLCDLMAEINGEEAEDARGQWSELKREEDCISFIFEGAYRTYIEEWDEVCDNFETLCPYFEGVRWAYELAQKRENPEKGWFPNKYYLDMRYKEYGDDDARSFRTLEDVYKRIEELTGTKISSEEDIEALRSALKEKNDDTFIHIYEIEEIPRGGSSSHTLFPWGDMSDWEIEEVDDDIPEETSEMTSMQSMFLLSGETTLDLSSFDTSKVVNMSNMFDGCSALSTLDLSSFDTSKVVDMSNMFDGCSALSTLDLSSFDTSKVTDMSEMFMCCYGLTSLDLSSFDTSKVTDMTLMFGDCRALTSIDLSLFDTSNVTDMSYMFCNCGVTSLDLSLFDTSKVTDMRAMFSGCTELTTLDLSSFDTSRVTDMTLMFGNCRALTSIDLSLFDTSNVTDMSYMFCNCGVTSLDLSLFDTSKVTNMSAMFSGCTELTTLDLSSFDTSRVTDMHDMFVGCDSLKTVIMRNCSAATVRKIKAELPEGVEIIQ